SPLPGHLANAIFSVSVYIMMALETGFILAFYGFLIGVSYGRRAISKEKSDLRLPPCAIDNDSRRGFEVFEGFYMSVLLATLFGYIASYLMRVQNLFLRTDDYYNLFDMVVGQIGRDVADVFDFPSPSVLGIIDHLTKS